MNLEKADLNLLVYLDVLLRERSVTAAAAELGITQPALSNALKKLRKLFDDPLLIRSSGGMMPTERAIKIQPKLHELLATTQKLLQPVQEFKPLTSQHIFRLMVSDYAEATLIPSVVYALRREAPNVVLDLLTPSDVQFSDMEEGKVDMAINRFDDMPQSFHQVTLWQDDFACIYNKKNAISGRLSLKNYMDAKHIWVSKTGWGAGHGLTPQKLASMGWVDQALERLGKKRDIAIFTRHYQMPALLAENNDLIATLPSKMAKQHLQNERLLLSEVPFHVPSFDLKMAWSPILQHNPSHRWLRKLISYTAERIKIKEDAQRHDAI